MERAGTGARDAAAAGSTPEATSTTLASDGLAFDHRYGDSPLLSLIRQEWVSWHHRRLANVIAARWPLPGQTKSLNGCRTEGIVPGVLGLHSRFLFGQLRTQDTVLDPLLPYAPDTIERDSLKELMTWGVNEEDAQGIVQSLAVDMGKAARHCNDAWSELVQDAAASPATTSSRASGSAGTAAPSETAPQLAICGRLSLVPLQFASTASATVPFGRGGGGSDAGFRGRWTSGARDNPQPAQGSSWRDRHQSAGTATHTSSAAGASASPTNNDILLLVYEPDLEAAARCLAPPRAAEPVPVGRLYGPLNRPLYSASAQPDVIAALAAAGIPRTEFTSVLQLRSTHISKLALLYRLKAAGVTDPRHIDPARVSEAQDLIRDQTFLKRVYCLLARYETFTGNVGGFQGALPHYVFDQLQYLLGVQHECFASPLNTHFPSYCSAFLDTDVYFGSSGSFFPAPSRGDRSGNALAVGDAGSGFAPIRGSFECNPPFVNDTMKEMAHRLKHLLAASEAVREKLLFFVIVPSWEDAYFFKLLLESEYLRCYSKLRAKEHEYIDGLQYKVTSRATWGANVDSTWFLLATSAAAAELAAYHARPSQSSSGSIELNASAFELLKQRVTTAFGSGASNSSGTGSGRTGGYGHGGSASRQQSKDADRVFQFEVPRIMLLAPLTNIFSSGGACVGNMLAHA